MGLRLISTSSYLPENKLSNFELEKILNTSDSWIRQRTGIESRHISKDEDSTDLIIRALKKLKIKEENKKKIKAIIVASITPDSIMPSLASIVHRELDLGEDCFSLDVNMACSGYVAGLRIIESILEPGELGLVVGVEVLSKIINWEDRSTAILFGDGVGIGLWEKNKEEAYFTQGTRGDRKKLSCPGNNIKKERAIIRMEGQEVYKFTLEILASSIKRTIGEAGLKVEDIDYLVLHQANKRIIEATARKLGLGLDRFPSNIKEVGNTSSASIPILLDDMERKNIIKKGQNIILAGFGGGLTWSIALLKW